jgi:hypothetical protein
METFSKTNIGSQSGYYSKIKSYVNITYCTVENVNIKGELKQKYSAFTVSLRLRKPILAINFSANYEDICETASVRE